jgi:hypothetical protein
VLGGCRRQAQHGSGVGRRVARQGGAPVAHQQPALEDPLPRGAAGSRPSHGRPQPVPRVTSDAADGPAGRRQVAHEHVGVGRPDRARHGVLFLERHLVALAAGDAVEGDTGGQQQLPGVVEVAGVGGLHVPGRDQGGDPGARPVERPARPLERLQVAQAARPLLEVGGQELGDGARRHGPQLGGVGQRLHDAPAPLGRQRPDAAIEVLGEAVRAGQHPHAEHRRQRGQVGVRDRQRLLDRAGGVAGHEPGVPQRVPERVGDRPDLATAVVQQHDVDVRRRAQLATGVGPHRQEHHLRRRIGPGQRRRQLGVDEVGHRAPERRA